MYCLVLQNPFLSPLLLLFLGFLCLFLLVSSIFILSTLPRGSGLELLSLQGHLWAGQWQLHPSSLLSKISPSCLWCPLSPHTSSVSSAHRESSLPPSQHLSSAPGSLEPLLELPAPCFCSAPLLLPTACVLTGRVRGIVSLLRGVWCWPPILPTAEGGGSSGQPQSCVCLVSASPLLLALALPQASLLLPDLPVRSLPTTPRPPRTTRLGAPSPQTLATLCILYFSLRANTVQVTQHFTYVCILSVSTLGCNLSEGGFLCFVHCWSHRTQSRARSMCSVNGGWVNDQVNRRMCSVMKRRVKGWRSFSFQMWQRALFEKLEKSWKVSFNKICLYLGE